MGNFSKLSIIIHIFCLISVKAWASQQQEESLRWRNHSSTISLSSALFDQNRTYLLTTNNELRDNFPHDKKVFIREENDSLFTRSGNLMFDGLFALALQEARLNSVERVSDPSFYETSCHCFQTGKKWLYVWTRDIAYSTHLGLAHISPLRSRNSLAFKLSRSRLNKRGPLEIVQDTGSGGSWPISTDRVIWALGAFETLKFLSGSERSQFLFQTYEAIRTTIQRDRLAVYDPKDGLYRGEQSFLDWREQSYAPWVRNSVVHIGVSKALSTNAAHYAILQIAADLAKELQRTSEQTQFEQMALELKRAINRKFWLEEYGLYSTSTSTEEDQAPLKKFDLLGLSLAIILGIADDEQAQKIMSHYPHSEAGAPVLFPQQPHAAIYHNRAIWPFVSSYALLAAKKAKNYRVVNHNLISLIRGSAFNLSNMENFEFLSLQNHFKDGSFSGPIINSQRQLWSVAGYLSMVTDIVFGKETTQEGIRFHPFITNFLRRELFNKKNHIELSNFLYKGKKIDVKIHFPSQENFDSEEGYYKIGQILLNKKEVPANDFFNADRLNSQNQIEIFLTNLATNQQNINIIQVRDPKNLSAEEYKNLFAPHVPHFESLNVEFQKSRATLKFKNIDHHDVLFNVYRNNQLVAKELKENTWIDQDVTLGTVYCYTIEAVFPGSKNASHHTPPACVREQSMTDTIQVYEKRIESNDFASIRYEHGKYHYNDWGNPGSQLYLRNYKPTHTGNYYFLIEYGNGNPVSTGVTAAVKQVDVVDETTGKVIASQVVMMPHLQVWQRWENSSPVSVRLDSDRFYTIVVRDFFNMSYLNHFRLYKFHGGASGFHNNANISAFKFFYQH